MIGQPPFLTTAQASFYLGVGARYLARLRLRGGGPRFRRHARIFVYHIDDLDAWSLATGEIASGDETRQG